MGNDAWIGYGTHITSSCHSIGNGAVIGTGSVVTKDVPPYAIVVGAPAKIIRYRFSPDDIAMLEKSEWWLLSPTELKSIANKTNSISDFCHTILNRKLK